MNLNSSTFNHIEINTAQIPSYFSLIHVSRIDHKFNERFGVIEIPIKHTITRK